MVTVTPKDIVLPEIACDGDLHMPYKIVGSDEEHFFDEVGFWKEIQRIHRDEWTETVNAYEANPNDFHDAWHYVNGHPAFWVITAWSFEREGLHEKAHIDYNGGMANCVDVHVTRVNPASDEISDDRALNTKTQIWLECGKYPWPGDDCFETGNTYHDCHLDSYADTYEEAVINLAYRIHEAYGNDRRVCDAPYDERVYPLLAEEDSHG